MIIQFRTAVKKVLKALRGLINFSFSTRLASYKVWRKKMMWDGGKKDTKYPSMWDVIIFIQLIFYLFQIPNRQHWPHTRCEPRCEGSRVRQGKHHLPSLSSRCSYEGRTTCCLSKPSTHVNSFTYSGMLKSSNWI